MMKSKISKAARQELMGKLSAMIPDAEKMAEECYGQNSDDLLIYVFKNMVLMTKIEYLIKELAEV